MFYKDAISVECCHINILKIFFVQLIDQGKINADDVASEMGISLDSLQAALIVCVKCIFVHFLMSFFSFKYFTNLTGRNNVLFTWVKVENHQVASEFCTYTNFATIKS